MEKKKRNKLILTACFILVAGILYTVSYIKPWKKDGILLDDAKASTVAEETAIDCANSSLTEEAEDVKTDSDMDKAEDVTTKRSLTEEVETYIYVHLCGAVKEPGVYQVLEGSRLDAVVTCAGGLTEQAATEYVNLAQAVVDGQQYFIPSTQDVESVSRIDYTNYTSIAGGKANSEEVSGQGTSNYVNINTAMREELMTLPGVGEAKADSIITYRETEGQYEKIEDIMKVSGIKEGLFQKIKDRITAK